MDDQMRMHDDVEIGDLGQAILVLKLMRKDLTELTQAVKDMNSSFAPQVERVRADFHAQIVHLQDDMHAKVAALRAEMKDQSTGNSLDRFLTVATRIGAALMVWTAVVGLVVGAVRYLDTRAYQSPQPPTATQQAPKTP